MNGHYPYLTRYLAELNRKHDAWEARSRRMTWVANVGLFRVKIAVAAILLAVNIFCLGVVVVAVIDRVGMDGPCIVRVPLFVAEGNRGDGARRLSSVAPVERRCSFNAAPTDSERTATDTSKTNPFTKEKSP